MAWGDKKKAKKAEQFEKSKKNLNKAAEAWNEQSNAQKKAARRWGGKK